MLMLAAVLAAVEDATENAWASESSSHGGPVQLPATQAAAVDRLAGKLLGLEFHNEGTVTSSTRLAVHQIPCGYLEPDNVSSTQFSWASRGQCRYVGLADGGGSDPVAASPDCSDAPPATHGRDTSGDDLPGSPVQVAFS